MRKDQKGSHLLLPLMVFVVLAVVVLAGIKVAHENSGNKSSQGRTGSGPNYKALAACGSEPMLTYAPMDLSKLDQIAPLGGINPPDHTIPTDHMYFMYRYERPDGERYSLVAPGNGVVTSISYSGKVDGNTVNNPDYALEFAPCKGVMIKLAHINTLENKLKGSIGSDGSGSECRHDKPAEGEELLVCIKNTDVQLTAGDIIGTLGAKYVAALDVGAHREGYKDPGFVNPEYYHSVDAVCPITYFTKPIQDQMYALINRTEEPLCGQIGQDKNATLQGTWFAHKDPEQAKVDWSSHFSLVHDANNPAKGTLALAGKVAGPFIYVFNPRHEGNINREPSETTTGNVYCYQHDGNPRFDNGTMAGTGKVLLRLVNNKTMQVEHSDGACTGSEAIAHPTVYYR